MKLGFSPMFVSVVHGMVAFLCTGGPPVAKAAPPRIPASTEDALADDDIDTEDIAARGAFVHAPRGGPGTDVLGGPPASTWVSLVGFSRRTIDDRREIGGFVVLGLPLDRFAQSPTRATQPPPDAALPGIVRTSGASPGPGPEPIVELAVTARLARSCVEAAWRAAHLAHDDARLDGIVARAHWSAVLPEARLRAVRFEDARLSLDTGTDTSKLRDSAGANVGLEARLTWRFDRLLYADDEPSFERIRLEHRDARSRIAGRVLEALFHWQRALLDLRTLPPAQRATRDEADVMLRLLEAEATLDVLTNGWFTMERARRPGIATPIEGPMRGGGEL